MKDAAREPGTRSGTAGGEGVGVGKCWQDPPKAPPERPEAGGGGSKAAGLAGSTPFPGSPPRQGASPEQPGALRLLDMHRGQQALSKAVNPLFRGRVQAGRVPWGRPASRRSSFRRAAPICDHRQSLGILSPRLCNLELAERLAPLGQSGASLPLARCPAPLGPLLLRPVWRGGPRDGREAWRKELRGARRPTCGISLSPHILCVPKAAVF